MARATWKGAVLAGSDVFEVVEGNVYFPPAGRGPPLRVRPATPADAPAISRVMRAAVRGAARDAPGVYPPSAAAAWARLPALYHRWAMTAGGERYLLAERAGRALGFAAWRGRELTALFVLPRAGGRGLGRRLLERAASAAHRAGARSLVVKAALAAAPFYRACGFTGARAIAVPLPGGARLPAVRLVRRAPRPRPAAAPRRRGGERAARLRARP